MVVILAILAATVLPQFANASDEATASAIKQNLHVVRSQIELYRVQHNGALPGTYDDVDFTTALTSRTDRSGAVNAASGVYGPYIKRVFPRQPRQRLERRRLGRHDRIRLSRRNRGLVL